VAKRVLQSLFQTNPRNTSILSVYNSRMESPFPESNRFRFLAVTRQHLLANVMIVIFVGIVVLKVNELRNSVLSIDARENETIVTRLAYAATLSGRGLLD
jgi:hypothetical protein